jgi:peptidoglycan/LPS O-acetylase OafA/YrhL
MSTTAPAGLEPAPGTPRFPAFDALRAFAALSIVAFHLSLPAGADGALERILARFNAGVAIFFVISGFLLYRPFASARLRGTPAIGMRAFWRRRLLRIVPGYWFALSAIALAFGAVGFAGHWPLFYGFAQIYVPSQAFNGIPAAWSLCVEMSFYLVLPFYAWLAERWLRGNVRAELALLGVLALCSMALHELLAHSGQIALSGALPSSFFLFAVGMGLALVSVGRPAGRIARTVARHGAACWALAGALLLAVAFGTSVGASSIHPLYAPIALLAVLPAAFEGHGRLSRALRSGLLAWLGLISYGIYLWHQALIFWLVPQGVTGIPLVLATVGATLAIATFSYYVVERPALRRKARRSRRVPQPAPAPAAAEQARPRPVPAAIGAQADGPGSSAAG